jgi:hypothetical protein
MLAAVGTVDLVVLQQQVTGRADALPTLGAHACIGRVVGSAVRAAKQYQARLAEIDRRRRATRQFQCLPTLRAHLGRVEDARLARRAAPHK